MKNIVTDTSAVVAVASNEPTKAAIIQATKGAVLYAPESLDWEVGNAITAMLKRGRVNLAQADMTWQQYQKIPVNQIEINIRRTISIAAAQNIYAYDAYMIACALEMKMPLISIDRGLIHAATAAGVTIIRI